MIPDRDEVQQSDHLSPINIHLRSLVQTPWAGALSVYSFQGRREHFHRFCMHSYRSEILISKRIVGVPESLHLPEITDWPEQSKSSHMSVWSALSSDDRAIELYV
jgi:hypothetical protein